MTGLEIAILLIGVLMVGGSFFLTKGLSSNDVAELQKMSKAEIKTILNKELEEADKKIKVNIDESVDKKLLDAFEDLERKTDKETNDKIKEISQYSDTVLSSMNKSHDEIMFMYDMLNKKQETVTELTEKVDKMQSALKKLQAELEEKEKIIIEEREKNEKDRMELENSEDLESLKVEFQKKLESNYDKEEDTKEADGANRNDKILKLSKEGLSEIEIAKKLGLGIGEVKLVLGLFNQ